MSSLPTNASESTKKLNPHLWPAERVAKELPANFGLDKLSLSLRPKKPRKRIRQRTKPLLNKLETEFLETLLLFSPRYCRVRTQSETFTLANGVRYTPDLTSTWSADDSHSLWRKHAYEVKGPQQCQDDAVVKLKVAAKMYPEIDWFLVWKDKATGEWREQRILSE